MYGKKVIILRLKLRSKRIILFLILASFSCVPIKAIGETLNTSGTAPLENNGQRRNIFNIKPKNDITITGFEQRYRSDGVTVDTFKVWWRSGSVESFDATSDGWTLFGTNSSSFVTDDAGQYTSIDFGSSLNLNLTAGQTYGLMVGGDGRQNLGYTNGNGFGEVATAPEGKIPRASPFNNRCIVEFLVSIFVCNASFVSLKSTGNKKGLNKASWHNTEFVITINSFRINESI